MFRLVNNWNVLVPFGFGGLTVDHNTHQVHYRLSLRQLVIFATVGVGIMTTFLLLSPVWQPLLFMPVVWLWLVGGNLAIGIPRFESFVGRAITTAANAK